jgi:hypothetical protein
LRRPEKSRNTNKRILEQLWKMLEEFGVADKLNRYRYWW